jgi:hypothetical protein
MAAVNEPGLAFIHFFLRGDVFFVSDSKTSKIRDRHLNGRIGLPERVIISCKAVVKSRKRYRPPITGGFAGHLTTFGWISPQKVSCMGEKLNGPHFLR